MCETSIRAVKLACASSTCQSSEELAAYERRMVGWQEHAVEASLAGKEGAPDELEDELGEDHDVLGLGMDLVEQGAVAGNIRCELHI